MEYYILLLSNGDFVSYEQTGDYEIDVISATYYDAHMFPTLDEAKVAAKRINERIDGEFSIFSAFDVVRILKNYSVE